jgi:hypothetical protein
MTRAEVLELIGAIANAFGLVTADVQAFAEQQHPELRLDIPPDASAEMDAARADALERAAEPEKQ